MQQDSGEGLQPLKLQWLKPSLPDVCCPTLKWPDLEPKARNYQANGFGNQDKYVVMNITVLLGHSETDAGTRPDCIYSVNQ